MACGDKTKNTCGEVVSAACVRYELDIPEISPISGNSCVTIEETTKDLYELVDKVFTKIDTTAIKSSDCVTYVLNSDGDIDPKEILKVHDTKIVELLKATGLCDSCTTCPAGDEVNTNTSPNLDITKLNINFRCLADECDGTITNLKELLQAIINKLDCP